MRNITKQYLAEFLGTGLLTFFGCGTAMLVGCVYLMGCGYVVTALAFGLVMAVCVYLFGGISGCHINPAVTLAMYLDKRIKGNKAVCYIVCQLLGALVGSELLAVIFRFGNIQDQTGFLAANGLGGVGGNPWVGVLVEMILTMVFVGVVLKITDENSSVGNMNGVIIGATLMLVHLIGIGFTGTSVNPARSFGPAIECLIFGNSAPIQQLYVFIIGPLLGSVLAVKLYQCFKSENPRKNVRKEGEPLPIYVSDIKPVKVVSGESGQNFEQSEKEDADDMPKVNPEVRVIKQKF